MAVNFRSIVAPKTPSADPYAEAERRRALADALQAQARKPRDFGTMNTGQAVTLGIAQLAEALLARRAWNRATDAENAARQGMEQSVDQTIRNISGDPRMTVGGVDEFAPEFELESTKVSPTSGKPISDQGLQLTQALAGIDPRMKQSLLMKEQMSRAFPEQITPYQRESLDTQKQVVKDAAASRAAEGAANREARMEELKLRLSDARLQAADRLALQRELAQLQAETARAGQAITREVAAMRQDAEKAKADAAAKEKDEPKQAAALVLTNQLASLRDAYGQLQDDGGITDTTKGGLDNAGNYVQSSAVGQLAGRVFGTKNQSIRNQIAQARPLLVQSIKQATGMSAQQMNSNVELQLFLKAATDPTLDVQANLKALDELEKFAAGTTAQPPSAPTAPAEAGGLTPEEQAELDALRKQFGR